MKEQILVLATLLVVLLISSVLILSRRGLSRTFLFGLIAGFAFIGAELTFIALSIADIRANVIPEPGIALEESAVTTETAIAQKDIRQPAERRSSESVALYPPEHGEEDAATNSPEATPAAEDNREEPKQELSASSDQTTSEGSLDASQLPSDAATTSSPSLPSPATERQIPQANESANRESEDNSSADTGSEDEKEDKPEATELTAPQPAEETTPKVPATENKPEEKAGPRDDAQERIAVLLTKGEAALKKRDYTTAIAAYSEIVGRNSESTKALHNRGLAYHLAGNYDAAIEDFGEAIRLDDKIADTYYGRGLSYLLQKNYGPAIDDFSKAIELNPNYAAAYFNRGLANRGANRREAADADLAKAAQLDPKFQR